MFNRGFSAESTLDSADRKTGQVRFLGYDDDGNLTLDGQSVYTWDAENRLIVVEPINPQANDKRVAFAYDYMGRRVRKQVFDWTGSA